MPTQDYSAYKVVNLEGSSATKQNNMIQAIQDGVNGLTDANIAGGAAIAAAKIAPGTSNGQFFQTSGGVAVWGAGPSSQTYQTTLPGGPADGQQTIFVDSTTTPTYAWLLRYNTAFGHWQYLGGAPLYAEVTAREGTTNAAYVALTTAGPSIALPLIGDYFVEVGCEMDMSTSSNPLMSYDIGGTGAVDADAMTSFSVAGGRGVVGTRPRRKTGLTAVTLTAKYKSDGSNTASFQNRWMRVTPIQVG